jgi:hypothetical protein
MRRVIAHLQGLFLTNGLRRPEFANNNDLSWHRERRLSCKVLISAAALISREGPSLECGPVGVLHARFIA